MLSQPGCQSTGLGSCSLKPTPSLGQSLPPQHTPYSLPGLLQGLWPEQLPKVLGSAGLHTWFLPCGCYLRIPTTSWTGSSEFSFCTRPCKWGNQFCSCLLDSCNLWLKHLLGLCLRDEGSGASRVLTTSPWWVSLSQLPLAIFGNTEEINTFCMISTFQVLFWSVLCAFYHIILRKASLTQAPSHSHFKDEEMDSVRVQVICLKSNSDAINSKACNFSN